MNAAIFFTRHFQDVATRHLGLRRAGPRLKEHLHYLLTNLLHFYTRPERAYHNLDHLVSCLSELAHAPMQENLDLILALWFHDVIYDPQRQDNEERSADMAELHLSDLKCPPAHIATVRRLILATRHAAPPADEIEQAIVDVDLAILGQPAVIYEAYEAAIRQEYAFMPGPAFCAGRAKILQNFLARPAIYYTPHFQGRYEFTARANLRKALSRLEEPGVAVL